jgi:hypothetical protein
LYFRSCIGRMVRFQEVLRERFTRTCDEHG